MHADILGALTQINKIWHTFEHRGQRLTKDEVKAILTYAKEKGYQTTAELTDNEVDDLIWNMSKLQVDKTQKSEDLNLKLL